MWLAGPVQFVGLKRNRLVRTADDLPQGECYICFLSAAGPVKISPVSLLIRKFLAEKTLEEITEAMGFPKRVVRTESESPGAAGATVSLPEDLLPCRVVLEVSAVLPVFVNGNRMSK